MITNTAHTNLQVENYIQYNAGLFIINMSDFGVQSIELLDNHNTSTHGVLYPLIPASAHPFQRLIWSFWGQIFIPMCPLY
jgi:hypothetical protein